MRRLIAALLLLFTLLSLSVGATEAESALPETAAPEQEAQMPLPTLSLCRAGGICNGETGEILFSKEENTPMYPAASVKLMTALVAIEHYAGSLDTEIRITDGLLAEASGVTVGLKVGEVLTVRQLLACLVIGSANDAALVLARASKGSVSAFVDAMNAKADALGMADTEYRNPTGLHHDKMVSTVKDTLTLAMAMRGQDTFMNLCGRGSYEIPETAYSKRRVIHNRNYLVSGRVVPDYYDPSVDGMSYGSTYEAGGVVVASSMKDGTPYLAVVFGGKTETVVVKEEEEVRGEDGTVTVKPAETKVVAHAFSEVKSLLNWAKKHFARIALIRTSDAICEIEVKLGDGKSHVTLFADREVSLYLPTDVDLATEIRTEQKLTASRLTAPVAAGSVCGELIVYHLDKEVARVKLVTRSSVDRSLLDYYVGQVKAFVADDGFRDAVLIFIALLVLYALCMSVWRHRMRRKSMARRARMAQLQDSKRDPDRKSLGSGKK